MHTYFSTVPLLSIISCACYTKENSLIQISRLNIYAFTKLKHVELLYHGI